MTSRIAVAGLFLCTALTGQEPEPPTPIVVFAIDGPARLHEQFLPTDVGTMLATKQGAAYRRSALGPIRTLFRTLELDDALIDLLVAETGDYRGRITLLLEPTSDEAFVAEGMQSVAARILFTSDETIDWKPLSQRLARGLDGAFAQGCSIEVVDEIEWSGSDDVEATPIALYVDLQRLLGRLRKLARTKQAEGSMQTLGFASLRDITLSITPSGPNVRAEAAIRFVAGSTDVERGVFAGLFSNAAGVPRLHRLKPETAATWHAYKFDLDAFARPILDGLDPSLDLRQRLREFLGVDLDRDLANCLGDEILAFGDGDETNLFGILLRARGRASFVFEVHDGERFDQGWNLVATRHRLLSDEPDVVAADVQLHAVRRGGRCFAHCRFGSYFAIAIGDDTKAWLREVVERAGDPQRAAPSAKTLERLESHAPPGFNGCSRVAAFELKRHVEWPLVFFPGTRWYSALQEATEGLEDLARDHDLEFAHSMTGSTEDCWRVRVFW